MIQLCKLSVSHLLGDLHRFQAQQTALQLRGQASRLSRGCLRCDLKASEGPTRSACGLVLSVCGRDPSGQLGGTRTTAARPEARGSAAGSPFPG